MYRFALSMLITILLLAASAAAQSPDKKPLLAGVATSNITPWLGDGLVGNFGTPPPAKYVHDELHARCFVLDDGTTRIALVVSDNIYISREVLDDAGLAPLARLTKRLPKRTLAVPDPNLRVLRSALPQFVAVPISVNDVARFDSAPAQHDDQAGH